MKRSRPEFRILLDLFLPSSPYDRFLLFIAATLFPIGTPDVHGGLRVNKRKILSPLAHPLPRFNIF